MGNHDDVGSRRTKIMPTATYGVHRAYEGRERKEKNPQPEVEGNSKRGSRVMLEPL